MQDLLANLGLGFGTVLRAVEVAVPGLGAVPLPLNVLLCFLGCLVGTLIGVLPGVGPIATIAMLLPITFGLDPVGAPRAAMSTVATQPAKNEPRAATPNATPARPWRAIWWPSSAVTTEVASPGMFTRMAVVEPPYWAP